MNSRRLSCWLLYLLGSVTVTMAQLPYGKKLPPPAVNSRDVQLFNYYNQKKGDLPSVSYDTVMKQFVRHAPGQRISNYSVTGQTLSNQSAQAAKLPVTASSAFQLTKDINTRSDGFPENNPANAFYSFAVLNNVSYFFSNDGIHGNELWRSDGTTAGTYLVKDINPFGDASSGGANIIAANGLLFFAASTGDYGLEPWVSDGTEAGTHLLKDINFANSSGYPSQFVDVNGVVFFTVTINGTNDQLWKTDGTEDGTVLVKDFLQSFIGYRIFELMEANNLAYFIVYTWNTGFQLFRSDGTDIGTYLVRDIGWNTDFDGITAPSQLTEYNNALYFSANDNSGRKLWVSDGTFDGTMPAPGNNDILMQENYNNIYKNYPYRILNNVIYFAGYTFTDGGGLYKYDAVNGAVLVKDLTDVPDSPFDDVVDFVVPVDFTIVNDKLFFKVISNIGGSHDQLWITNGQADQTQLIKEFPSDQGTYPYNFFNGNGVLYFVVNNYADYGTELWSSDGSSGGTSVVKDINPGKLSAYPDDLTFCNGKLLFRADSDAGTELWSSAGSAASTVLVKDINTTTTNGSDAGYMFKGIGLTEYGIVFNAFTPSLGGELYKSDGTAAGTGLLNDIAAGADWSYPNNYMYKNKVTYFIGDDVNGTAIYKTNGASAGLQRITPYINRQQYFVVNYNITDQGLILYTLGNHYTGDALELWRSNGTEAGTFLLTTNLSYYNNNYIEVIGNTAFFIAGDFNTGYELWKSDGTVAGTKMVKDINPGFGGSDPYSFYVYKNTLYFGAYDGTGIDFHRSLWKSDGTEKGTVKLKAIEPTYYQSYFNTEPQHVFQESGGTLYFTATEYNTYGNELWKTNGTDAGTKLVKDINPYTGSFPNYLTDLKGTLYFFADDGVAGLELWTTNGTEKGTAMIKDITPGFGSSYSSLCTAGGKLFFMNNTTFPAKLWSSEGTAATTKEVVDDGLVGLTDISQLTASGNKLFFGAYTKKYGREMYVGDAATSKLNASMVQAANKPIEIAPVFEAELYPNPAKDKAVLHIQRDIENATISIVDMNGKTIWQKNVRKQTTIQLPVSTLTAGVYMVTVNTDKGSKMYQLVKE
ncbi:ELWxxDGT repeat protein [Flavisolibacter tropicus]|uniref:Secretion system C-terminal sorting domain-containing protein n=1 Tax=Flavisolibacter tropicus TaxID=1492898 RepID=A0A172TWD9_9BACT|nr:ELWxxDGT repeat protein [Flavisolibacter tropicus]ANE51421.1 hypothetical protein SY85_13815 [Flavisolibacter tropicus]